MSRKSKKATQQTQSLNATTMRIVFSAALAVILLAMSVGFYLTYTSLQKTAEEVSRVQTEAQTSDARVQNLITLEKQLKENSLAFDRAQQIVADSKSYQYQNQIINDLTHYANQSHIGITSFTFQDATAPENSSAATTSQTNTSVDENSKDNSSSNTTVAPTPATTNTIKSTQVSIQLSAGVAYQDLLHFLHLIEQNLTRMQVSDVVMSKGEGPGTVSTQTLNIEVYIR